MLKPIKLWVSSSGPNPWKPAIILEELGLQHDLVLLEFEELQSANFKKLNPNGKVPVMEDPNTDIRLWESGAIVQYLIEQYDTEKKLTYSSLKEKHLLNQWLMFQMSQQGPFFGQASWFNYLHPEKLPSAVDRYVKQTERILEVLDGALQGREWLVGDKCTYADLSFFMWNFIVPISLRCAQGETPLSKYPNVMAWHQRMESRDTVQKIVKVRQGMMEAQGFALDASGAEDIVNKWQNLEQEKEKAT